MADNTKIEWTDSTYSPITGCSVVSPGCTNCYAMRLAGTRMKNHPSRIGLTNPSNAGPVWNGQVRFNEQWLDQPLRWRRPRRIFVCAHGDLFHEDVPFEWIDRVFAVMAMAPQHQFQILTKRAERMRDYVTIMREGNRSIAIHTVRLVDPDFYSKPPGQFSQKAKAAREAGLSVIDQDLPNVWLGVSVEDQARADERIPALLDTPAAVRFISAEPLLGPVYLKWLDGLNWVIAGGESGPGARPSHPDWFRFLRDQCAAADVPYFFKQWGDWHPSTAAMAHEELLVDSGQGLPMVRVGKKRAGALLDGCEHRGFPA